MAGSEGYGCCGLPGRSDASQSASSPTAAGLLGPILLLTLSVSAAEGPVPTSPNPGRGLERVTLRFRDVPVQDVLGYLADAFDLNMVQSVEQGGVSGKISLNLENVTLDDALKSILSTQGYGYRKVGDVVVISKEGDELVREVIPLKYFNYTDVTSARALIGSLKNLMSERGKIEIIKDTNKLLVADLPENIARVKETVLAIDVFPKQVVIEAELIEVIDTDVSNLGISWNREDFDTMTILGNTEGGGSGALVNNLFKLKDENATAATGMVRVPGPRLQGISGGNLIVGAVTARQFFGATIDALIEEGKAQLLSKPKLTVLNGQTAKIIVGEEVPYQQGSNSTSSGVQVSVAFKEVGIKLEVTPQITDDGMIILQVNPEVSSVKDFVNNVPSISKKESNTRIMIADNDTVAIGGLVSTVEREKVSRVPVLGSIPLIKYLFSSRGTEKLKSELIVLITPRIIRDPSTMGGQDLKPLFAK
jgi:type IV pilus assembly protein PilQ